MSSQGKLVSSSLYVSLGLCQLNQWALDFEGNFDRIERSIREVKAKGGYYRVGPELEMCGYSCDDHFNEAETTGLCWQNLVKLLRTDLTHNCLVDVGMPVEHRSVRYNCRVYMLNGKIILIRPKMFLACDGAYRENRWFGAWKKEAGIEEFVLPKSVQKIHHQRTCPFGFAAVQCNDCLLASETCEELFVPQSPHLSMCLAGVDIFTNASASYFQVGKMNRRFELIMAPMAKMGGIYMYCNLQGNDGGKLGFDGGSFVSCNGEIVRCVKPYQIQDVQVIVEHINVGRVRNFRACNPSYAFQASTQVIPTVRADIWLSGYDDSAIRVMRLPELSQDAIKMDLPDLPEEILSGCALWLWDYLRRSGGQGFMLALSGGIDSCACALIVHWMCRMLMEAVMVRGDPFVLRDIENVLRIKRTEAHFPKSVRELCFQLLHTVYLGTANSSRETRERAAAIAQVFGTYHMEMNVDDAVASQLQTVQRATGMMPRFRAHSGTREEDLALQNVQARARNYLTYSLASLIPTVRAKDRLEPPACSKKTSVGASDTNLTATSEIETTAPRSPRAATADTSGELTAAESDRVGYLIVIGTGNLDEVLSGYFTKHDCSAGDVCPIGGVSKVNLKNMLHWAARNLSIPILESVAHAAPTAELVPGNSQTDEEDIGLTYDELYLFGLLRKTDLCGPVEMFERLFEIWRHKGTRNVTLSGGASPFKAHKQVDVEGGANTQPGETTSGVFTETMQRWLNTPGLGPEYIGERVKIFFNRYRLNRHKASALGPSYHCESYDCEPSRYDWRPINYPKFNHQFRQIDVLVREALRQEASGTASSFMIAPSVGGGSHTFNDDWSS